MFAQAVYLMFSAVYVCKETVEHVLLSAGPGGGEKHHHHHHASDDDGTHGCVSHSRQSTFLTFYQHPISAIFAIYHILFAFKHCFSLRKPHKTGQRFDVLPTMRLLID